MRATFEDGYKNYKDQDFKNDVDYYAESLSSNESPSILKMGRADEKTDRRESRIIYEKPITRLRAVSDISRCRDEQTSSVFDKNTLARLKVYEPRHECATSDTAFLFRKSPKPRL